MNKRTTTVTDEWSAWINENEMLIKYDLSKSYSTPYSWKDILDLFPESFEHLMEMVSEPLKYGPFTGPVGMRDKIAEFYPGSGIENILPTHGAVSGNDIVLRLLQEDGDNCVLILPTYNQIPTVAAYEGYDVRSIYLDSNNDFSLNISELRNIVDNKTKLIAFTNPNYPIGTVFNKKQLEEIVKIASSVGAYILCDEVFRPYDYGKPIDTIFGMYERAVVVSNLTKFLSMPGIRVGWVVATKELISEFTKLSHYHGRLCGILDQKLLLMALGKYNTLKANQLELANKNLIIIDKWVQKNKGFSYKKPHGGATAFVQYKNSINSIDFCKKMILECGVKLIPGSLFGLEYAFAVGFMCETRTLISGLQYIEMVMNLLDLDKKTYTKN